MSHNSVAEDRRAEWLRNTHDRVEGCQPCGLNPEHCDKHGKRFRQEGAPLPFPMPGNRLPGAWIVIASVEYFDDERGAVALVLLLEPRAPFFTVAHYALTDVLGDDVSSPYQRGEMDIIGRFMNIVPAVEAYKQNGGDY